jgi:hypothetical protein
VDQALYKLNKFTGTQLRGAIKPVHKDNWHLSNLDMRHLQQHRRKCMSSSRHTFYRICRVTREVLGVLPNQYWTFKVEQHHDESVQTSYPIAQQANCKKASDLLIGCLCGKHRCTLLALSYSYFLTQLLMHNCLLCTAAAKDC